jgi:hypothetical protein
LSFLFVGGRKRFFQIDLDFFHCGVEQADAGVDFVFGKWWLERPQTTDHSLACLAIDVISGGRRKQVATDDRVFQDRVEVGHEVGSISVKRASGTTERF